MIAYMIIDLGEDFEVKDSDLSLEAIVEKYNHLADHHLDIIKITVGEKWEKVRLEPVAYSVHICDGPEIIKDVPFEEAKTAVITDFTSKGMKYDFYRKKPYGFYLHAAKEPEHLNGPQNADKRIFYICEATRYKAL